jgi:transcriptional regulator with XRE-family HTH domain
MPAKPLTEEQKEDAQRLRAAFEMRKRENPSLTQEGLAHLCDWKTQGAVNQYLLGKIPLNLAALVKFARALDVPPEEISPRLAELLNPNQISGAPSWQNVPVEKSAKTHREDNKTPQSLTDLRGDEGMLVSLYRELGGEKEKTEFLNLLARKVEAVRNAAARQSQLTNRKSSKA